MVSRAASCATNATNGTLFISDKSKVFPSMITGGPLVGNCHQEHFGMAAFSLPMSSVVTLATMDPPSQGDESKGSKSGFFGAGSRKKSPKPLAAQPGFCFAAGCTSRSRSARYAAPLVRFIGLKFLTGWTIEWLTEKYLFMYLIVRMYVYSYYIFHP